MPAETENLNPLSSEEWLVLATFSAGKLVQVLSGPDNPAKIHQSRDLLARINECLDRHIGAPPKST